MLAHYAFPLELPEFLLLLLPFLIQLIPIIHLKQQPVPLKLHILLYITVLPILLLINLRNTVLLAVVSIRVPQTQRLLLSIPTVLIPESHPIMLIPYLLPSLVVFVLNLRHVLVELLLLRRGEVWLGVALVLVHLVLLAR